MTLTFGNLVGVERFELPTSCSQSRRATRLRYTPNSIPEEIEDARLYSYLKQESNQECYGIISLRIIATDEVGGQVRHLVLAVIFQQIIGKSFLIYSGIKKTCDSP